MITIMETDKTKYIQGETIKTKSSSVKNKSRGSQDESVDIKLKTNMHGSHNKCIETKSAFINRKLVVSQNKHIVTRSGSRKSQIVSAQSERTETKSGSRKSQIVSTQSERTETKSGSRKNQIVSTQSERTETKSGSRKSQIVSTQSERIETKSGSRKSQIHDYHGKEVQGKGAISKNTIRDLPSETMETKHASVKRTIQGLPGSGIETKRASITRQRHGCLNETDCADMKSSIKLRNVSQKTKKDSGTCSVTQLEEGEIVDGGSSPYAKRQGKRKRRRRRYKAYPSESITRSMPKKFIDKVEIVNFQQEGHSFRDVRHGQMFLEQESTTGGRQRTQHASSIDASSASTGMKTWQVESCKPGMLNRLKAVEMKGLKGDQGDLGAAVALEEGEILSDPHLPGNTSMKEVLSRTGSDMSISSEDSGTQESIPRMEHKDSRMFEKGGSLQGSCDMVASKILITSAAPEAQSSTLDPLAAVFIPRCLTSGVIDVTEQSNMTDISEIPKTFTHQCSQLWPTFSTQSHSSHQESQFWPTYQTHPYFPQTRDLVSNIAHGCIPYSDPKSLFQAPCAGVFSSVSSIWSYITAPHQQSQLVIAPFLWPPSSCLPGSNLLAADSSAPMFTEYSDHKPGRRIHFCPTAEHTCPEIRNTARCWQNVKQADTEAGSMELKVMSYNILSQELMDRHLYLYSKCREADLEWDNRGVALLSQIIAHDADIVCLQEVQQDHWMQDIRDTLAHQGYAGVYKKQTGDSPHGCAILYKTNKFRQLKVVPVEFVKGGILDRNNIGLILLLQPRQEVYGGSVKKICVATTHLLFNPRRGDVKLAQLMVLLAEIDKHAYQEDQPESRQSGHKGCPISDLSSLDQMKPFHSGHCDISPEVHKTGSPSESQVKNTVSSSAHRYCPIILCGDFNSEPFCDLYKFITTSYLKYDDCIARLVSGQEEAKWSGTDRLVVRKLLPESLSICETCQYLHELRERQNTGGGSESRQLPKVNSGQMWHYMNFQSVYTHFIGDGYENSEISSHHNSCSCTVDYIFYSQIGVRQAHTCDAHMAGSEDDRKPAQLCDNHSDIQRLDSDRTTSSVDIQKNTGIAAGLVNNQKDSNAIKEPLELLARYRLLTDNEVTKIGFMPNSVFPSDHLCLIAKFLLR